jgi:hypothetical protein
MHAFHVPGGYTCCSVGVVTDEGSPEHVHACNGDNRRKRTHAINVIQLFRPQHGIDKSYEISL